MVWLVVIGVAAFTVLFGIGWLYRAMVRWSPVDDFEQSVAYFLGRYYVRWFHRLRVDGLDRVRNLPDGPVLLVANHTAGVDPILISAMAGRPIRWMMAEDMRIPSLEWFWSWFGVIFVARKDGRGLGLREAMKAMRNGEVLGLFPEGGLERPPRRVMPFQPGVGLMVSKLRPTVVPILIDGTPQVDPAWASLWSRGHATLRVLEPRRYDGVKPTEIVESLRDEFLRELDWPANDAPARVDGDASKGRWREPEAQGDAA